MAEPGALERPWVRTELIRALATGEHTQSELARRFEVTPGAVTRFVQRHAERIAVVASRLDDEFAGLWSASKVNRISVLQDQIEAIAENMADPDHAAKSGMQAAEMHRVQQQALRAIADELGQIPARLSVQHSGSLEVRVNGVDVAALQ